MWSHHNYQFRSTLIPQPDLQPVLVTPREGTLKPETVLRHLRLLFFLSALNTEAEVGLAAVVCPVTVVVNVRK